MSHKVHLALLVTLIGCTGCKSAPNAPKPTTSVPAQTQPQTQHLMSSQARATAAEAARAHSDFKLFLQKTDLPTVLVVPEATTDAQLKSLLWFLRTRVRSGQFKDLGLHPTATLYGRPGYQSGVIVIYRGSKCAREMYITSGPDPCGSSIHKSASYHWGDGGDAHADGADLVTETGTITPVFDASDGWQTDQEARDDPDGAHHRAAVARIRYATSETARQSRRGSDLVFFVEQSGADQPLTELSAVSYQFSDEAGQKRFLNEYVFLEQEHLCALGFTTVKLGQRGVPGKSYPIICSPSK